MTSRRRGFTLIEMLVVIAIIAVLGAILFPVLSKARENGRRATCMSNMGQIGQAMELYVQDYNGFLPTWSISHPMQASPPATKTAPAADVVTWDISIGDHLKNTQILICPSNPNVDGKKARAYAMAQYTQNFKAVNLPAYGIYRDKLPSPSKTVLLFEKGAHPPGSWGDCLGQNVYQSHNSKDQAPDYNEKPFHFDGKNILYADYHVKFVPKTSGPYAETPTYSGAEAGDVAWPGRMSEGGGWPEED